MSRDVVIDSASPVVAATGRPSNDFIVRFSPPLELGGRSALQRDKIDISPQYECALIHFYGWNTIPNISATLYGNTIFTYTNGPAFNVVFPDGIYSFSNMQTAISASLVANGFLANDIRLQPNTSTNRVAIFVAAGFTVDLTTSLWRDLAGFTAAQSPLLPGTTIGANIANITNSQGSYYVHVDITNSSNVNGQPSDVLLVYRPAGGPSSEVTIDVATPIYVSCKRNDFIESIRVYVTDNLNRPITYGGEDINIKLHFRKVKDSINYNEMVNALKQ